MLEKILEEKLTEAIRNGWSVVTLRGGLIIYMTVENGVILTLTLRRIGKLPSDTEWNTVAKHFPWPITHRPRISGWSMISVLSISPKYVQPSLPLPNMGHPC